MRYPRRIRSIWTFTGQTVCRVGFQPNDSRSNFIERIVHESRARRKETTSCSFLRTRYSAPSNIRTHNEQCH